MKILISFIVICQQITGVWKGDLTGRLFSLDEVDANEDLYLNKVFYKEKYIVDEATKTDAKFEQRLIVTYSIKYRRFLEHKRENDIDRANKWIAARNSKQIQISAGRDLRQYIESTHETESGEKANKTSYSINEEAIAQNKAYDGFYAVCTSLSKEDMSVSQIIQINKMRWEIEDTFRIMKTEFKSRPVYLSTDDHIKAHFCTCFIAITLFRLFAKKLCLDKLEHYTTPKIIDALRNMNIVNVGSIYSACFKPTEITDAIQDKSALGEYFDCEFISAKTIRNSIKKISK